MAIAEAPYRISTEVETITPKEALALLASNDHNRPMRAHVADLAREMAEGRWTLNGESIKVSATGRLLDGQHRCLAVVESGAVIQSVVVRGLPNMAQETVDTGNKRSVADILALRGETQVNQLAAALMIAWKMDNNGHLWNGTNYAYPTSTELIAYLEANPGIRISLSVGNRMKESVLRYPGGTAVGLHFLMSRIDPDQADEFWDLLYSGIELLAGHPILTLRNYLVRDLSALRRMDARYRAAITIKAWNAYRAGRNVHVIKWVRTGDKPEAFPVPE